MKKFLSILFLTIACYVLISSVLSFMISVMPEHAFWIVTHRAPFIIIDIPIATIEGYNTSGNMDMYGMTDDGFFVSYDPPHEIGDTVMSVFVYNPFTNYCDDVIARYDIASYH